LDGKTYEAYPGEGETLELLGRHKEAFQAYEKARYLNK
jgi:hypothetical protein